MVNVTVVFGLGVAVGLILAVAVCMFFIREGKKTEGSNPHSPTIDFKGDETHFE